MHDPRGVRGAHRVAHLLEDRKDGRRGERALVRHELRQILAVEQLHGEPRARDELGPHHLERAELRGVPLLGDVHGAHAALAQLPHDPEVAREERTGREGREGAWHFRKKRTPHSAEKTDRRSVVQRQVARDRNGVTDRTGSGGYVTLNRVPDPADPADPGT
jgi:hypothetical protein